MSNPVEVEVEVERSRPRMVTHTEALRLLAEAEADDVTSEHDIDSIDDDDDEDKVHGDEVSESSTVTDGDELERREEAAGLRRFSGAGQPGSGRESGSSGGRGDDDDDDEDKVDQNPFAGSSILGDRTLYEPLMQMLTEVMQPPASCDSNNSKGVDHAERSRPVMVTHEEALRLLAEAEADDVTTEHDSDSDDNSY